MFTSILKTTHTQRTYNVAYFSIFRLRCNFPAAAAAALKPQNDGSYFFCRVAGHRCRKRALTLARFGAALGCVSVGIHHHVFLPFFSLLFAPSNTPAVNDELGENVRVSTALSAHSKSLIYTQNLRQLPRNSRPHTIGGGSTTRWKRITFNLAPYIKGGGAPRRFCEKRRLSR